MSKVIFRVGIFLSLLLLFCVPARSQQYELTCPQGSTSIASLSTYNYSTGKYRQNYCVDTQGNVTENSNVNISLLTPMYFVGSPQYPDCPTAIAAASLSSGSIVYIPGTGPVVNCPATDTNETVVRMNFDRTRDWCNGDVGGALPPCNAENFNNDDGNVMTGRRLEFTTNHQDLNGISLALWSITTLKNATANGSSGIDGFSANANSAGTLSGTFFTMQAHEANAVVESTGGTISNLTGLTAAVGTFAGSTTAVTTGRGVNAVGCRPALGATYVNCYAVDATDQTGRASGQNYSLFSRGPSLLGFSGSFASGGMDAQDHLGVAHAWLRFDSSDNTLITAITSAGVIIQDNTPANQVKIDNSGMRVFKAFRYTETTAPATASGIEVCYGDSTAHALECSYNNGAFTVVPLSPSSTTSMKFLSCGTTSTCAQTNQSAQIILNGGPIALAAGTLTITSLPFTNSTSYVCSADDSTGINGIDVVYVSGSSVTFNGTGTDSIRYSCIGN